MDKTAPRPAPGTLMGTFWTTYYYVVTESDYSGASNTTLYDAKCKPLATVPAKFSDAICIEGSGRLRDGRMLNYDKKCSCGRPCPTGGIVCYTALNKTQFPWGMGSHDNPLTPLRSWAVDTKVIPFGTTLYVKEWDGVSIPGVNGLGGFIHDGCFRADDLGGGIHGKHIDFFAGTKTLWKKLETIFPTKSKLTVYHGGARCPRP